MPTREEIEAAIAYQKLEAAKYPEMQNNKHSGLGAAVPTPRNTSILENMLMEIDNLAHSFNNHLHTLDDMHRRLIGASALPPPAPAPDEQPSQPLFVVLDRIICRYRNINIEMHTVIDELKKNI